MGKSTLSLLMAFVLCLLAGCTSNLPASQEKSDGSVVIVATLFPQYDFARQIAGDNTQVKLLLPPGVESHSYEPTPADIIAVNQSDLFIYTGEAMEPWAERLISGMTGQGMVLDISRGIELDEEGHEGESAEEHAAHAEEAHGGLDPHIWTSPANAMIMVQNLTDALCTADPQNADDYRTNAKAYLNQLEQLDNQFMEIVSTAQHREIFFGGRFALHYFAKQYGLTYEAAFDSCSTETEPSVGVMTHLIDEMKEKGVPVIFHEEMTDPKVSRLIAGETGAKLLLLHSCHNVTKEELQAGVTYLSLMEQNAVHLKEGLNGWR